MSDTIRPILRSLTFTSVIDLSSGDQPLTFTASATDDLSGVDRVYINFAKPINYGFPFSTNVTTGLSLGIYDSSDSFSDGQSTYKYTLTKFNAPGSYAIDSVVVYDKAGNYHTYSSNDLAALGAPTGIVVTGSVPPISGDTTPPTLTSLTFAPTFDLSGGDKPITFTASANDSISGVGHVDIFLTKPITLAFPGSSNLSTTSVFSIYDSLSDPFSDGQSSGTFTLSHLNAPGSYAIDSVHVYDKVGNQHTYSAGDLAAFGSATAITLMGSTADTTRPTLTSLTFAPTFDLSGGDKPITFTASANDSISGVGHVDIFLTKPITLAFPGSSNLSTTSVFSIYDSLSDPFSDGQSSGTFTLSHLNAPGSYAIDSVHVYDKVGNQRTYSAGDLADFGSATSITLTTAIADVFRGGPGDDTYNVDHVGDVVIEDANAGNDTVYSTIHYRLPANVENLVLQGSADLQGYGNELNNAIAGNSGSNILDGGVGADWVSGGQGNDAYFVDNPSDLVTERPGEGIDTVYTSTHYRLGADVEQLVLQGSADLQGYGNELNNAIAGNSGNNILDGGAGADWLSGGQGNDAYFVDSPGDVVTEKSGEGIDTVYASTHYRLGADVEQLVLQGSADLQGYGNELNNAIAGNSGNNILNGGAGADMLAGGQGNDAFVFDVGQAGGDIVTDFAGNGAAAGDWLLFVGYGSGATFTSIDTTHWQVNYNGGTAHDIITFMNGASIDPTDLAFM
jgi:Ca2+-binding RTX toxin-like protein